MKTPKEYAEELMKDLLKIDFMSREQAKQSALININSMLDSEILPIKRIRYFEEVSREVLKY